MTNLLSQCNFWLQGSQAVHKVALFPSFLAIFVVFRHNFILNDFIPHHLKFHNFLQIISCSCNFLPSNFMPSHIPSRHVLSCHILNCHFLSQNFNSFVNSATYYNFLEKCKCKKYWLLDPSWLTKTRFFQTYLPACNLVLMLQSSDLWTLRNC